MQISQKLKAALDILFVARIVLSYVGYRVTIACWAAYSLSRDHVITKGREILSRSYSSVSVRYDPRDTQMVLSEIRDRSLLNRNYRGRIFGNRSPKCVVNKDRNLAAMYLLYPFPISVIDVRCIRRASAVCP